MSYQANNNQKKKFNLDEYVTVNERLTKFYEKYPEGRILTEIVSLNDGVVVMKATAYRDGSDIPAATGHAYEKEGSSFINNSSYIENCETSCIGRCLASLGLEIKKSIASFEEVANAKLNQQGKVVKEANKAITSDDKNMLLTVAAKRGYQKDVFEAMLEKKYKCNLTNIDSNTYNSVYANLSRAN